MAGLAFNPHPKENKTHMRQNQLIARSLANYHTVGPLSAHNRLHRAIPAAFFITHRSNGDINRQLLQTGIFQQLNRHHRRHQTALHISRSPAVHFAVPNHRHKWRIGPVLGVIGRHHVHMPVKHQGRRGLLCPKRGIDIKPVLIIMPQVSFLILPITALNTFFRHRIGQNLRSHPAE